MDTRPSVHVVSHGPGCLDGLVSAVVLARTLETAELTIDFPAPRDVDAVLQDFVPCDPERTELWITDISWTSPETAAHLDRLVGAGMALYWMDHHKSALDRFEVEGLGVQPTEYVLDMDRAGCRIVWDYLAARAQPGSREAAALAELNPLVSLADDVDRWVLKVPSSRDVALAVNSMPQDEAFDALMTVDADLRWPRSLRQAMRSVRGEIEASLELAESTRTSGRAAHEDVNVVAAECTGYAGEVAERWKSKCKRTVFALLDRRAQAVSLRRTEDCPVDLSRLAASFGGGGHAAAAGFDPEPQTRNATAVARAVVIRLDEHQEGGLG